MVFVAKKSGAFRGQNTISVKKTLKNVNTRTGSQDIKNKVDKIGVISKILSNIFLVYVSENIPYNRQALYHLV